MFNINPCWNNVFHVKCMCERTKHPGSLWLFTISLMVHLLIQYSWLFFSLQKHDCVRPYLGTSGMFCFCLHLKVVGLMLCDPLVPAGIMEVKPTTTVLTSGKRFPWCWLIKQMKKICSYYDYFSFFFSLCRWFFFNLELQVTHWWSPCLCANLSELRDGGDGVGAVHCHPAESKLISLLLTHSKFFHFIFHAKHISAWS